MWPGSLDSNRCDAMFGDPSGLFRKMFGAEPWMQRRRNNPNCWDVRRDAHDERQDAATYFRETFSGAHCNTNWYEGNKGKLGEADERPSYNADAPALLGFDETIDAFCGDRPKENKVDKYKDAWPHARECVRANLNILSLYGTRVPYNICRNLEWQVCAALGKLPGQQGPNIIFSKAPSSLDPSITSWKPFGKCRGWREPSAPGDCLRTGYATDDIYFLEVCLFNQICSNGEELFHLRQGETWHCQLDVQRFAELQQMLMADPSGRSHGTTLGGELCEAWCDCTRRDCSYDDNCRGCAKT